MLFWNSFSVLKFYEGTFRTYAIQRKFLKSKRTKKAEKLEALNFFLNATEIGQSIDYSIGYSPSVDKNARRASKFNSVRCFFGLKSLAVFKTPEADRPSWTLVDLGSFEYKSWKRDSFCRLLVIRLVIRLVNGPSWISISLPWFNKCCSLLN